MAENKSKQQKFLDSYERQRLNKPCNRTIDLRGKVAGEIQEHIFGNRTHYLDDRGYLIAKQLLARANGRYTVGVYEALLKVLTSLDSPAATTTSATTSTTPTPTVDTPQVIVKSDKNHIQYIPLNRKVHRQESRIIFATPVQLTSPDLTYHAVTLNITPSAISITLKRISTLNKEDKISVSFSDLVDDPKFELLKDIPYSILHIKHDELRSRLILIRNRNDDNAVTQQLELWCQLHNSPEFMDSDNELFNLTCDYYLRLYCRTLTNPQFWLNSNDVSDPIKVFQLNPTAKSTLSPLRQDNGDINISLLPFSHITDEACHYLVQVSNQEMHIARRDDIKQLTALINHHLTLDNSHILLLTTQEIEIESALFKHELSLISEKEPGVAIHLEQDLNNINNVTSVTDLTTCFQHIETDNSDLQEELTASQSWPGFIKTPTHFHHYIQRAYPRYVIRTTIKLRSGGKVFDAITLDVSTSGLLLSLPGETTIPTGTRIYIDFIRWQSQTTTLNLKKIVFIVQNYRHWAGNTYLGLQRHLPNATGKINQFFAGAFRKFEDRLVIDHQDIIISQQSRIFGNLLGRKLNTIPFYLGVDSDNNRILQAIATTTDEQNDDLWHAFQELVTMMYASTKSIINSETDSVHFGIYCYQNTQENWKIYTDDDFSSTEQKALFIRTAVMNKQYHFFHCRLCPIKPTWLDQETDLNDSLSVLRSYNQPKVTQIRKVLSNLFASGELTDITDIISTNVK